MTLKSTRVFTRVFKFIASNSKGIIRPPALLLGTMQRMIASVSGKVDSVREGEPGLLIVDEQKSGYIESLF